MLRCATDVYNVQFALFSVLRSASFLHVAFASGLETLLQET